MITNFGKTEKNIFQSSITIADNSSCHCKFNIMPHKYVEESITIKNYTIYSNKIEAVFDRKYHSDMIHSPDHLIIFTMMAHTQKMIYIYLCQKFGFSYEPNEAEKIKIWPIKITCDIPKLVRRNKEVTQTVEEIELIEINSKQFLFKSCSTADLTMKVYSETMIYLI